MAEKAPTRIQIQYPAPAVDDGQFAVKRCVGDTVAISADVFRDGHEMIRAVVRHRGPGDQDWRETELERIDDHLGGVRWGAELTLDRLGSWQYAIEAWTDVFGTWRDELERKVAAQPSPDRSPAADRADSKTAATAPRRADSKTAALAPGEPGGVTAQDPLAGEMSEGIVLLRAVAKRTRSGSTRAMIEHALATLEDDAVPRGAKLELALGPTLLAAIVSEQEREDRVRIEPPLRIEVDRVRARFGAWYELFPRSWGGLKGVQAQLPRLAELGFDVIYLPPIHPIGLTNRKGADNAPTASGSDPGSPWSIGDATGGHDAIHPDLGTKRNLQDLTHAARKRGLDIALDFAINCSADHPWLEQHPEWFHRRPDGTLKYAENPPKRYQDIYNVNWQSSDWRGLWDALLDVVLGWVDCGVKVFRVDNPHTKPFAFWSWLIEQVHARDRDVIFLAEAFTKRAVMRHLAKLGFSQSYTYFTWKNSRHELTEYVSELASSGEQEYFRPNFFANTPDILHAALQHGGRPAFEARLVLAATLSPSYGIYSGFEHVEHAAVAEGSEEYLHSEKFELKARSLDGELLPLVQRLNLARRENPALGELSNVTFLATANEALIAYVKQAAPARARRAGEALGERSGENTVITVVNLDPRRPQEGLAVLGAELGLPMTFTVRDLLTGERYQWGTGPNYVRLEPGVRQAHVNVVEH
ncbi:MAG: maltotransferase domain-containing protein [Solirubrobacteraceae bacterium]